MRFASAFPAAVLCGLLLVVLAGCASFPRGAGLTSEVLARSEGTDASFAVEPVTRGHLARHAQWPVPRALGWLARNARPANRVIAPGDTVSLTLWTTEDNSLLTAPGQRSVNLPELLVSASGRIFLPWLGEVAVAGSSPDSARARIEERYLDVMPSAQVQLQLSEGRQNAVSLVSGVTRPGSYPLAGRDVTILQVLAEGGGVAPGLVNPQIRLHRGGQVYGIALERLAESPQLDTALQGGDRILAVADDRVFLSLGAAGQQARHAFPHEQVSALDALAIIGGVAATRADARAILILRHYPASVVRINGSGPPNEQMIFTIDLTTADGLFSAGRFRIRPDDLVYATESPLIGTRNLFGLIGSVFGLRNQAMDD